MTAKGHPVYNAHRAKVMGNDPARSEKEAYVRGLFSSVAGKYDLMNSILSLSRHKAWRRSAARRSGLRPGGRGLDACCGTGDFALELARLAGAQGQIVGVDFSPDMIDLARAKASARGVAIEYAVANVCELPFPDAYFDCVVIGFGVRNLADVDEGLAEMVRVLKPGGKLICLETSQVKCLPVRWLWQACFRVFSSCAAMLMGAERSAYEYLPRTARAFLSRQELADRFVKSGLADIEIHDLMFGAVCVHAGSKAVQ